MPYTVNWSILDAYYKNACQNWLFSINRKTINNVKKQKCVKNIYIIKLAPFTGALKSLSLK